MKNFHAVNARPKNEKAKQLLFHINKNYSTLAFCRRWLENEGFKNHYLALKNLVDSDIVQPYPPLSDVPGCYTAQFEHNFILRPTCKEVLTRSDDY
jgi:methionyl aminopeptidase